MPGKNRLTRIQVRLLALAQLGRINMAPLTVSVPLLGALTLGRSLALYEWLGLGIVGLCAHLFGFALHDLIDQPIDRSVPERQQHPLVTGRLGRQEAWIFVLIQPPLAVILYGLLGGTGEGLAVLCLSIGLGIVYDLWSKRGRVPRILSEVALALSIGLLCLAGAMLKTAQVPVQSTLYAVALTLVLLLLNSVSSGLKDLKTDAASGATSFILSTGSRMVDGDRVQITKVVWVYSAAIQSAIFICQVLMLSFFNPGLLAKALVMVLSLYAALHLRMLLATQSSSRMRSSMP